MKSVKKLFITKALYLTYLEELGDIQANLIFNDADDEYAKLIKNDDGSQKNVKKYVYPLIAVYHASSRYLTNAITLHLFNLGGKRTGRKLGRHYKFVTSLPFSTKIIWRHFDAILNKYSSSSKGYQCEYPKLEDGIKGVNITVCPFHEKFKELNAEEACCYICRMDQISSSRYRKIEFTREHALGEGDKYCDYRYKYNKHKK